MSSEIPHVRSSAVAYRTLSMAHQLTKEVMANLGSTLSFAATASVGGSASMGVGG